jgi:hypothetical protein
VTKGKIAAILGVLVLALAGAAEVGLRLTGVADVPLYRPDPHYGYIPAASQSGAWRNRMRWAYNSLSMGVAEPFRPGGVLLIGDSIVNGGNQADQSQRLGPQLEGMIGKDVWPVSAKSWALLNELAWMRDNPRVVRDVERIVIVLNPEDFEEPSVWTPDPNRPEHKPVSQVFFLLDRLVLAPMRGEPVKPKSGRDWKAEFAAFRRETNKPVLVVLYSGRGPDAIERAAPDLGPDVLIVKQDPRWKGETFSDYLHIQPGGNALLARLIAERLAR